MRRRWLAGVLLAAALPLPAQTEPGLDDTRAIYALNLFGETCMSHLGDPDRVGVRSFVQRQARLVAGYHDRSEVVYAEPFELRRCGGRSRQQIPDLAGGPPDEEALNQEGGHGDRIRAGRRPPHP